MKFKKILSLSAVFVTIFAIFGNDSRRFYGENAGKKPEKVKNDNRPDLVFNTDTVHLTENNLKTISPVAGAFLPGTNTVVMTYYVCADGSECIKKICDGLNGCARVIRRHEMQHARMAKAVYNVNGLSSWDRARVAVMDEMMARGAEIIEGQEYRLETGRCFPYKHSFLGVVDRLILARHNQICCGFGNNKAVDFTDSVIANIVLKSAADNFVRAHNSINYKKRIRNESNGVRRQKYIPHNQCDEDIILFLPKLNQWGALWTYDVSGLWGVKKRVDVWNSASDVARKYVISKVDSLVMSDVLPGQISNLYTYKKTR